MVSGAEEKSLIRNVGHRSAPPGDCHLKACCGSCDYGKRDAELMGFWQCVNADAVNPPHDILFTVDHVCDLWTGNLEGGRGGES